MRLKYEDFAFWAGSEPEGPAAEDLARRAFEIIYPKSGIGIIFLAGIYAVGNRFAVG